ncbi:hypothetical protein SAY87_000127 [Trapa incisa]|uniref:Uncharacterized protein n=1 Tax=Trapa incisa TaxID=236973 RepID=A0AAN7GEV3_9MYRT|nr:hypothetical protein SAY87_000127 [Trapa incisa]
MDASNARVQAIGQTEINWDKHPINEFKSEKKPENHVSTSDFTFACAVGGGTNLPYCPRGSKWIKMKCRERKERPGSFDHRQLEVEKAWVRGIRLRIPSEELFLFCSRKEKEWRQWRWRRCQLPRPLLISNPHIRGLGCFRDPLSAAGSGLEASFTDEDVKAIALKNVKIVIESQSENRLHVSPYDSHSSQKWEEIQEVFNTVLTNFALTVPPIPGFPREKGAFEFVCLLTILKYLMLILYDGH